MGGIDYSSLVQKHLSNYSSYTNVTTTSSGYSTPSTANQIADALLGIGSMAAMMAIASKTQGGSGGSGMSEVQAAQLRYDQATAAIKVIDEKIAELTPKVMTQDQFNAQNNDFTSRISDLTSKFEGEQRATDANLTEYNHFSQLETKCNANISRYESIDNQLKAYANVPDNLPADNADAYADSKVGPNATPEQKAPYKREFETLKQKVEAKKQLKAEKEKLEEPIESGIPKGTPADQLKEIQKKKSEANGKAESGKMTCEEYLQQKKQLETEQKQLKLDFDSSKATQTTIDGLVKQKDAYIKQQIDAEVVIKTAQQSQSRLADAKGDLKTDKTNKHNLIYHQTNADGSQGRKRNFIEVALGLNKYGGKSDQEIQNAKKYRTAQLNGANQQIDADRQRVKDNQV